MTVHPNVRSLVLPKMIDFNKLLFLEFLLVPYSHFFFLNENENPHVHVEIPIYLCGSLARPLLLLRTLSPQKSPRHFGHGNGCPFAVQRKGDEVKGEGKQLVWNPKLQILLRNFYGFFVGS